jgi:3-isopropylmalate dehydratase small subunit
VRERQRTLAFARLLGHVLSDGSISVLGQGRMNVGQALDREAALDDIEILTGKRPAGSRYDDRKWSIALPVELTRAFMALAGVQIGKRIDQASTLPLFMLSERCPVSVVREFLGGLFGADGHAPVLHRYGRSVDEASLDQPAYSQSAKAEHVESLKSKMHDLVDLLVRCGVRAKGATIREYATRQSPSSYAVSKDGAPRVEVRLELPEGLSFVEHVGYRYCVDKQMRGSAAAVYWRTIDTINRQRLKMADRLEELHRDRIELTFSTAREIAAAELKNDETPVFPHYSLLERHDRFDRLPSRDGRKFRPLHRESCGFPSPAQLFDQLGVLDWFTDAPPEDLVEEPKRYCVEKESRELPTFSLLAIDRRSVGRKPVYDLAVDELNAFVAGTVAVHNCIGNSGPLPDEIAAALSKSDVVACSVLSGNRNFEGRIHPQVKMNFLASPPLVVAYAIAGNMKLDLYKDPLGVGKDGKPVFLKDVWPSTKEIHDLIAKHVTSTQFKSSYASVFEGDENWTSVATPEGENFTWDDKSTYVKNPPYFEGMTAKPGTPQNIKGARVLAMLGDSVTTDHISPAGNIAATSPAAKYLESLGVARKDFNSYGARRGNHEVMVRGTFANIRLKNLLVPGTEGGVTVHIPSGQQLSIYDAAMKYQAERTPLMILAGKEYGAGSSRDWAAKGTALLGVRAVIAESYERIHRSNLIGMGVVPLQYRDGETAASLGLTGKETFNIEGLGLARAKEVQVTATSADGKTKTFQAIVRIDTPKEQDYFIHGGILQYVLRQLAAGKQAA